MSGWGGSLERYDRGASGAFTVEGPALTAYEGIDLTTVFHIGFPCYHVFETCL